MKSMLLTMIALLLASGVFAQNKKEKKAAFSIGLEAAQPVGGGDSKGDGPAFGGSLQQEFLVKKTGITLNLGYLYPNNYYFLEHQAWLMAGARHYFTKNIFAGAQLGPSLIVGNDFTGIVFAYSPSIGVKLKPVDISLYYRQALVVNEPFSTIGARVGLVF